MRARTTAHRRCAFSYAPRDKRDLPARGHRGNVSGMAFSHRRHDRAAQQLGRSAWLRQRFHARNVYSRSAPTAWRELCRHTATRYWPKACVRSTRATPPHALTITLTCPRSSAQPHVCEDIGLAMQTMEPVVRGARGTCLQTGRRSRSLCLPWSDHTDAATDQAGTNTLSVGTNTLPGITKLPPPPHGPWLHVRRSQAQRKGETSVITRGVYSRSLCVLSERGVGRAVAHLHAAAF